MEDTKLIGQATEDQIAAWKNMHKQGVYAIEVEGHVVYIKGFDRQTMKYALSQLRIKIDTESKVAELNMEQMVEIGEIGLQNGWIGGSEEIRTNDRLWTAAALQVGELFEIAEANIKKL